MRITHKCLAFVDIWLQTLTFPNFEYAVALTVGPHKCLASNSPLAFFLLIWYFHYHESRVQSLFTFSCHIRGDTNALNTLMRHQEWISHQEAVHVTEVTQDTIYLVKREKLVLNSLILQLGSLLPTFPIWQLSKLDQCNWTNVLRKAKATN